MYIEDHPGISRRKFGSVVLGFGFLLVGCTPATKPTRNPTILPKDFEEFTKNMPKEVGNTKWSGNWKMVNGHTGFATSEGFFDQEGAFRHRIIEIGVPTISTSGRKLSQDEMKTAFKKEVNSLHAYEFIDTNLGSLDLKEGPREEVHVLADGLSALKLSAEEQRLLNLDYSNRKYNYYPEGHVKAGKPYYPDPKNPAQSVLREGGYVIWDGVTLKYEHLAAIDIMSTRLKVINSHGIKEIGPKLLRKVSG
ncbi:MAG: hypothetical protein Q7K55_01055 [Candidatus Levybacteria bacterium]|nr:hypothetical protein [Candidatus Levybacteria bacterium]